MPHRPDHLNPEDFAFLASVAGGDLLKAMATEDELDAHAGSADAAGLEDTVDPDDIPSVEDGPFADDAAAP